MSKPTDSEQLRNWVCTKDMCGAYNKGIDDKCTLCNLPRIASSSELASQLHYLFVKYESGELGDDTTDAIASALGLIQQRDQQRLSAALKALPKKQDEHPIDPETGAAVEVYGYEATFNQAIDQCEAALTAALGPDNSKIEE